MKKHINKNNTYSKLKINKLKDADLFTVLDTLDKQKVTEYVVKQVTTHKVPMLTFGKQGEIYKVALPYEGGQKYFLVAKKKKDTHDLGYDLRNEFRLQHLVYDTVKHPVVKIPELFGYQELTTGEQFMVMEYVPGQTLYTLLINKLVKKNKPERVPAKDDREADTHIVKIFGVPRAMKTLSKIETSPYLHSHTPGMKIFTWDEATKIKKHLKEFLDDMHAKGIYHRDLGANIRNIMFCPDGKIYLIDFGKSIKKENIQDTKEVYEEVGEDEIKQYATDEEIFDIIDAYTEEAGD